MAQDMVPQLPPKNDGSLYKDPRVNFYLQPGETLVTCPYDKSHNVLEFKLLTHLTKCRHNHMNNIKKGIIKEEDMMAVCPYDFTHHMHNSKMPAHMLSCKKNPANQVEVESEYDRQKRQWEEEDALKALEEMKMKDEKMKVEVFPGGYGDPGAGAYGAMNTGAGFWGACKTELDPKKSKELVKAERDAAAAEKEKKHLAENDPELNWELEEEVPWPQPDYSKMTPEEIEMSKRFSTYNPLLKMRANRHRMITNPQGLTKSEKVAYRAMIRQERLAEEAGEHEYDEPPLLCIKAEESGNSSESGFQIQSSRPRPRNARSRDVQVGYPGYECPH